MSRLCRIALVSTLCVAQAVANPAASDPNTLPIDAARSQAEFEVKVLFLIGLRGRFGAVRGMLRIDRAAGTAAVDATIAANDVKMRSHRYENWTKSAEFFDAEHFPQIHFVSQPFALDQLRNGGAIEGALTIRGVTKPARFELEAPACTLPLAGACAVLAQSAIRRSDYGMHSRRGALSDRVDLRLTITVRPGAEP